MKLRRTNRLTGLLLGSAAAMTAIVMAAGPANAVSISSGTFSLTLTGSSAADVEACYTLSPSNIDVNEGISYTETVHVHGNDQVDTIKSANDHVADVYSGTRVFHSLTPVTVCRDKHFADRDDLNEDTGLGKDELYAWIQLVPNDPDLKTKAYSTSYVSIRI